MRLKGEGTKAVARNGDVCRGRVKKSSIQVTSPMTTPDRDGFTKVAGIDADAPREDASRGYGGGKFTFADK
jgi:hypothetical protein